MNVQTPRHDALLDMLSEGKYGWKTYFEEAIQLAEKLEFENIALRQQNAELERETAGLAANLAEAAAEPPSLKQIADFMDQIGILNAQIETLKNCENCDNLPCKIAEYHDDNGHSIECHSNNLKFWKPKTP